MTAETVMLLGGPNEGHLIGVRPEDDRVRVPVERAPGAWFLDSLRGVDQPWRQPSAMYGRDGRLRTTRGHAVFRWISTDDGS